MNKEQILEVSEQAMAAFKARLVALNATSIAHGAAIMPRAIWAQGVVSAAIAVDAIASEAQAELLHIVLASDLGNSSQLGAMLLKKGFLKQESAAQAASSFAADFAAKAAAIK